MNYYEITRMIIVYVIGTSLAAMFVSAGAHTVSRKDGLLYSVSRDRGVSRKFVEYTKLPSSKEKALLRQFATDVRKAYHAQGYIMAYGGRDGDAKKASKHAQETKDYLVKELGLGIGQVVTIDCGYKEKLTMELWITPAGVTPPLCYPTVDLRSSDAQSNNSFNASGNTLDFVQLIECCF